jgi:hypothetical protein
MGFFRRARIHETIRFETPGGEDYVELRAELSKGEINRLFAAAPRNQDDMDAAISFAERFAELAVVDWSMTDENGNKVPFSLEEYHKLAPEPAQWLDKILVEHLQRIVGKEVEELEGKPST